MHEVQDGHLERDPVLLLAPQADVHRVEAVRLEIGASLDCSCVFPDLALNSALADGVARIIFLYNFSYCLMPRRERGKR